MSETEDSTANETESRNGPNQAVAERLEEAQLAKLRLEIAKLHDDIHGRPWERRFVLLTPLLTVLIAVAGFLFGVYQFQAQRQVQQNLSLGEQRRSDASNLLTLKLQLQERIRADTEAVLGFLTDETQTIAMTAVRLENLRANFIIATAPALSKAPVLLSDERSMSQKLIDAVSEDCDFARPRHAAFVILLVTDWPDYIACVKDRQGQLAYIAENYADAAEVIAKRDRAVISRVSYDADSGRFLFKSGYGALSSSDVRHFINVADGFTIHASMITPQKTTDDIVNRFGVRIGNPELAPLLLRHLAREQGGSSRR